MIALFLAAWQTLTAAASGAVRALKASRPLRWTVGIIAAGLAALIGLNIALKRARAAGARERETQIIDRVERDTKNAIEKIEEAERNISAEIGAPPVYADTGDGRGLTTDDLNQREFERLRQRAAKDDRNRRNPREDPRS